MNIDGLVKCIFLLWFNCITGDIEIRLRIVVVELKVELVFLEESCYLRLCELTEIVNNCVRTPTSS